MHFGHLLTRAARRYLDRTAWLHGGKSISFREAESTTRSISFREAESGIGLALDRTVSTGWRTPSSASGAGTATASGCSSPTAIRGSRPS